MVKAGCKENVSKRLLASGIADGSASYKAPAAIIRQM
jgi:hypothetical protein